MKLSTIEYKILISAIETYQNLIDDGYNLKYDDGSDLIEINSTNFYDKVQYNKIDKLRVELNRRVKNKIKIEETNEKIEQRWNKLILN
tara:strand:+ start:508 stop:771 length:264 start_codon:yes stop_codon:yes gene_type:complete